MSRGSRVFCVFIPMFLTMVALVFLIMIGLGGTNSNNSYLSNLYFLKVDTSGVTGNSTFNNNPANDFTDPNTKSDSGKIIIQNYYSISLWNYCAGNGGNTTASMLAFGQKTAQSVAFCTPRTLQYSFPFQQIWGLSDSAAKSVFGPEFQKVLSAYQTTSARWISTLYIMAVVACAVEVLVGFGGLFSRIGSFFTTISSLLTTAFSFAFSILVTLTYFGVAGAGNTALSSSPGIKFAPGPTMFIYMWLAVACSLVAGLFWAFSACCCSARPKDAATGKTMAERTPYTYERVGDGGFGSTQTVTATRTEPYEPFRHGQ